MVVAGVGALVYANTLGSELVAGDLQFIVKNDTIKHASVLVTAFTKGYWSVGGEHDAGTYYRPLTVLLDALDNAVWGGRPFGFHLTNLLLHAVASVAVLRLARAWTRSHVVALAAALLFAVLPIHVGATSYVSARSTLLCTIACATAMRAALAWRREALSGEALAPRPRHLIVIVACYVGALLSAETAATLPLLLLGGLWPPRASLRRWARTLAPLALSIVAVTGAYFVTRRAVLGEMLSHKEYLWEHLAPAPVGLTIAKIYAFYFTKLAAPTDLSYLPPFTPVLRAGDPTGLASLALLAALVAFAALGPRRFARERASVAWIIVTLLPVCGVLPLDHFVRAHYAYLPSIGWCVLLAGLARRVHRASRRVMPARTALLAVGGAAGVGLAACALQTVLDNLTWRSTDDLYARVLELEPEISDDVFAHPAMTRTANRFAVVHLTTAGGLEEAGRCDLVPAHCERARWLTRQRSINLQSRQLEAHCLFMRGARAKALELYLPIVDEAPKDPVAPSRVAIELLRRGETARALPYLALACERGEPDACAERKRLGR